MITLATRESESVLSPYCTVDVLLQVSDVPLDAFAFELTFDAQKMHIHDITICTDVSYPFCMVCEEIDVEHGCIWISCGTNAACFVCDTCIVIATIRFDSTESVGHFTIGDRTYFQVHC